MHEHRCTTSFIHSAISVKFSASIYLICNSRQNEKQAKTGDPICRTDYEEHCPNSCCTFLVFGHFFLIPFSSSKQGNEYKGYDWKRWVEEDKSYQRPKCCAGEPMERNFASFFVDLIRVEPKTVSHGVNTIHQIIDCLWLKLHLFFNPSLFLERSNFCGHCRRETDAPGAPFQ